MATLEVKSLEEKVGRLQATNFNLVEFSRKQYKEIGDLTVKVNFLEGIAFKQKAMLDDFLGKLKGKDEKISNLLAKIQELERQGKEKDADSAKEVEKLGKRMEEVEAQLEEKNARVTELQGQLREKNKLIRLLVIVFKVCMRKIFPRSTTKGGKSTTASGSGDGEGADDNREGDGSSTAESV